MAPKFEHCFTMRLFLTKRHSLILGNLQNQPTRFIAPITHGFLTGKGMAADIFPGGADWALVDPGTNTWHIDLRTQARSKDGHNFFVRCRGHLRLDRATLKVQSETPDAKTTGFGDHEWFLAPRIETDMQQMKWVETAMLVGQGRWLVEGGQAAAEYRIYRVVNGGAGVP